MTLLMFRWTAGKIRIWILMHHCILGWITIEGFIRLLLDR